MNIEKIKDALINFIVPIVSLVLTSAIFLLVILPSITAFPQLKEELISKQNLEAQLRTKITILEKLVDFKAVVDEDSILVSRVLMTESQVPELLTQVDRIAKESGLVVTKLSYSFGDAPKDEEVLPYESVILNLGALGNYEQINVFLSNLENSARLVDVSILRFSVDNTEESNRYSATFILRSPYLSVSSAAVTDAPINLDVSDPDFISTLDEIRSLKFYDVVADVQYTELEEETIEVEAEGTPEGEAVETEGLTEDEIVEVLESSE